MEDEHAVLDLWLGKTVCSGEADVPFFAEDSGADYSAVASACTANVESVCQSAIGLSHPDTVFVGVEVEGHRFGLLHSFKKEAIHQEFAVAVQRNIVSIGPSRLPLVKFDPVVIHLVRGPSFAPSRMVAHMAERCKYKTPQHRT